MTSTYCEGMESCYQNLATREPQWRRGLHNLYPTIARIVDSDVLWCRLTGAYWCLGPIDVHGKYGYPRSEQILVQRGEVLEILLSGAANVTHCSSVPTDPHTESEHASFGE